MKVSELRLKIKKKFPELDKKQVDEVIVELKKHKGKHIGKGLYQNTVNKVVKKYNESIKGFPDGNKVHPLQEPLRDGEKHAIYKLPQSGAIVQANWAGPGTNVKRRFKKLLKKHKGKVREMLKDENFINKVDKTAFFHDIRFTLFSEDPKKIREADERFVKKLNELGDEEKFLNIIPSWLGISAKIKLENLGLLKEGSFATDANIKSLTTAQERLMRKVEKKGRKQGYGKKPPKDRPPRKSQMNNPWFQFLRKYKEEHPDVNWRDLHKKASVAYQKLKKENKI